MIDLIDNVVLDLNPETIIKVMGVGGGGCNAVNYMYAQGVKDVSFLVCNTDKQALGKSSVPAKLQLGPGLGAGGNPTVAQAYAEENRERIHDALNDGTQMLFLTAGMGGGTGTGASSIVASVAHEMGILTVGIVTIPFQFEGPVKIRKAMNGVAQLAEQVDALLVINNEKLKTIYPDLTMLNAFSKSDDVVCNAARSIAEIITVPGYINTDFADVYNTLKNGKVAIMNVGVAKGENRVQHAILDALHSPLVNTNDVHGAKRILLQLYCSTEHALLMSEMDQIHSFVRDVGQDVEVQWGASIDDTMGEEVRVTLIATGYDVSEIPGLSTTEGKPTVDEAIHSFYKGSATQPAADTTADEQPMTPPVQVSSTNDNGTDEIHIDLDDEPFAAKPTPTPNPNPKPNPKPTTERVTMERSSVVAGWLRGRK